jgi:hypothetical protein
VTKEDKRRRGRDDGGTHSEVARHPEPVQAEWSSLGPAHISASNTARSSFVLSGKDQDRTETGPELRFQMTADTILP